MDKKDISCFSGILFQFPFTRMLNFSILLVFPGLSRVDVAYELIVNLKCLDIGLGE